MAVRCSYITTFMLFLQKKKHIANLQQLSFPCDFSLIFSSIQKTNLKSKIKFVFSAIMPELNWNQSGILWVLDSEDVFSTALQSHLTYLARNRLRQLRAEDVLGRHHTLSFRRLVRGRSLFPFFCRCLTKQKIKTISQSFCKVFMLNKKVQAKKKQ